MKSSLVSYRTTPYKALALPHENEIVVFDDIEKYQTGGPGKLATRVELSRDNLFLYLKVFCNDPEPQKVINTNTADGSSLWGGDLLEIFFGAMAPQPWQLQLCVGAGGGRFDSQGRYDEWSAKTMLTQTGWLADIRIPLSFLLIQDLSVGFNICRESPGHQDFTNWSVVQHGFLEAENYGEIFFCDYDTAFLAKTGTVPPKRGLNRAEFEAAVVKRMVPAWQVEHGPFLFNPDLGRITVSWNTAGMCGALLDYREAGKTEWITVPADVRNGVLEQSHAVHRVELENLVPGGSYEYRLKSVCPVRENIEVFPREGAYRFTAFSPERTEYSFGLCSDLHSDEKTFRDLLNLPQGKAADFFIMLGDFLSHASGPDAFYTGFLDTGVKLYAKEKPLVFVRGNHEQIGLFTADYSLLGHQSGRTWYVFRQGHVCYIALDAGNDHPDEPGEGIHRNTAMTDEEAEFLKEIASTDIWKSARFRVALVHFPIYRNAYDSNMTLKLVKAIPSDGPQIDLMLSGHVHKYFRLMPDGSATMPLGGHRNLTAPPKVPFPVIANDICTGLFGKVTADSITITACNSDGTVIDTCRIGAEPSEPAR